jgi:hypothetical protein
MYTSPHLAPGQHPGLSEYPNMTFVHLHIVPRLHTLPSEYPIIISLFSVYCIVLTKELGDVGVHILPAEKQLVLPPPLAVVEQTGLHDACIPVSCQVPSL